LKGAKSIAINPENAKVGLNGIIPTVNIKFRVFNPGTIAIVVNSIAGKLFLANREIGSIEFANRVVVPGRSTGYINVPIAITTGIFPLLNDILRGNLKNMTIKGVGTAFTNSGAIEFDNTINLNS
jgi:LEA14-like dessication related protein